MLKTIFAILLITQASIAYGQEGFKPPGERVLLPLRDTVVPVPGAYDSRWVVEAVATNRSSEPVMVMSYPVSVCTQSCYRIPPQAAAPIDTIYLYDSSEGHFVYVEEPGRGKVAFDLRMRDLSRQAESWGVSVPVVRERDVYTGAVTLSNVPVASGFRSSLRVYDFDDPASRQVRVKIRPAEFGSSVPVLVDELVTLSTGRISGEPPYPEVPATHVVFDLLSRWPILIGQTAVRIDVEAVTPGMRFWAFSSTTQNATQHVTLTLPD